MGARARLRFIFWVSCALSAALVACGPVPATRIGPSGADASAPGGSSGTDSGSTPNITFHKDVEPLLQRSCQGCHATGGIAPFALVAYADAKLRASLIVQRTAAGIMPPWGAVATPDCSPSRPWKNDIRLTSTEIGTLKAWHDQGDVEGDPKDAPPALAPAPLGLQGSNLELQPPAGFSITSPTKDQFRCFVLDPMLSAAAYVNGSFIVPGNASIVHHALVFLDPNGASKAKVTDPVTQSYDCFGGPGLVNTGLLAAWAPGGIPVDYPPDSGAKLDAGTLLVMQVHYHPHSASAQLTADQTKFQMRLASSPPTHSAATVLIGNFSTAIKNGTGLVAGPNDPPTGPAFVIPPDVTGYTKTMQFTVPKGTKTLHVAGIGGHEHYVGTAVSITIVRSSPAQGQAANECLLSIPRWDFDWQRFYAYDATLDQTPTATAGDVLQVKCTYDNTLNNPKVALSLSDQGLTQPQRVSLGETTLDEMCLGAFLVTD